MRPLSVMTEVPQPQELELPEALVAEIDEVIGHYPRKRSAAVMVLHALQDHLGCLTPAAMEWAAAKLDVEPIGVYELVTFYPMFRQEPAGKFQLRVCRTLSCALAGSHDLHRHLCEKLGFDSSAHGLQTTPDGRFSVEFVECLASCGTPPVMMCNEEFHEEVTNKKAESILKRCE